MPPTLSGLTAALLQAGLATDSGAVRGLFGVVIGVGLLIFVHELGHFLAAKWAGVRVEVFSLGFGRRLVGFTRGGTDYRISALPLGGYVRMLGQADDEPDQPQTGAQDDFRNKPPGKRFVILIAGVVMNLVLAAVGFVVSFGMGIQFLAAEVGEIEPGSAAARANLRPGDVVTRIDGNEVLGWQDLQGSVALADGPVRIEVLRDGEPVTAEAAPVRGDGDNYARLGVRYPLVITALAPESPLRLAGVEEASPAQVDRIRNVSSIDSRCSPDVVMSPEEVAHALERARDRVALTVVRTTYDRGGRPTGSTLLPLEVDVPQRPEYSIGLDVPDAAWVRSLSPDGAAAVAGLQLGDRILSIAGTPVRHTTLHEVIQSTGATHPGLPVPIVVDRAGPDGRTERHELSVLLALENPAQVEAALAGVTEEPERVAIRRATGRWLLGVSFRADGIGSPSVLSLADPDAQPVELRPGDRLLSLWTNDYKLFWTGEDDVTPSDPLRFRRFVRERGDEPFRLSWLPAGETKPRQAVVRARRVEGKTFGDLGFGLGPRQVLVQRGPLDACLLGLHQTWVQTARIFATLRSLFTGGVSVKELGGPLHIVDTAYKVAANDTLAKLIHLLAILSINLAVINVLPIPVLDGGHIVFLAVEKLKGRPVSNEVMAYAQWAGLLLIVGLMALVFFNDIQRNLR